MEATSRLFVKEMGIKAIFISPRQLPNELLHLDWVWESEANLSKLLGFFIDTNISVNCMKTYITQTLERCLQKSRAQPHTLVLWVAIANQMVSISIWYMVQLWPNDSAMLDEWDGLVKDFVWSYTDTRKCPRVDFQTITKPRKEGGLGLISISSHTIISATKAILWTMQEGEQTLQCIYKEKIVDLLEQIWGLRDFAWIVSPNYTRPRDESALWCNLATV